MNGGGGGGDAREAQESNARAPQGQRWTDLSNTVNNIIPDYNNPKYKINTHECTHIQVHNWLNKSMGRRDKFPV